MFLNRAKFVMPLLVLMVGASCSPDKKPPAADTASTAQGATSANSAVPVNTGWQEGEAGPAMLLSSPDNPQIASVVLPNMTDSTLAQATVLNADSLSGMTFDLFNRTGMSASGRVSSRAQSVAGEGCLAWPSMTLQLDAQQAWRVGFRRGMVTTLPLDSLEGFSSSDSALVTTELARLASALPASNDSAFQGLPFAVRKAYRASVGRSFVLVGDIVRKINEEANPREERLLLIAERPTADPARYQTVFESRAAGSEELVRTSDVMAAVRFVSSGRAAIIVSFDYENGSRVALIERSGPMQWKQTWRSAYAGC